MKKLFDAVSVESAVSHEIDGKRYCVDNLKEIIKREGMQPETVDISEIDCSQILPKNLSTHEDYIDHVKRVMKVKKDKPIILGPDNIILDGRHRLTKRIIKDLPTVKAYVFKVFPKPDYY